MKITYPKTIQVEEKFNIESVKLIMGCQKDVDSTNFEIYYKEIEIAYGHLNNKTNWAHVSLLSEFENQTDSHLIEDYLVTLIENRGITLN